MVLVAVVALVVICVLIMVVFCVCTGPRVENFQSLDPRKREKLEERFLGVRSSSNPAGGNGGAGNNLALPVANSAQSCNLMAAHVQHPSPSNVNAATAPPAAPPFNNYSNTNSHGERH